MRDNREVHSAQIGPLVVVVVFVLLLVVYPLSMGPAHWLCTDSMNRLDGIKGKAFLTAYYPLLICYQRGPDPLREAIGAYLSLWKK
jgi:hypothetical protein